MHRQDDGVRQDQLLDDMSRSHVDWSFAEQSIDIYGDMELDLVGVVKGDVDGRWGSVNFFLVMVW